MMLAVYGIGIVIPERAAMSKAFITTIPVIVKSKISRIFSK
ncbi:hypothetical protein J2S21_004360 [Peribacillus cavernae]|nr:hypothetical protein [Peribacillus cavernae]